MNQDASGRLIMDATLPVSYKHLNLNQRHSSGIFLGDFDPSKASKTVNANMDQAKTLMYAPKSASQQFTLNQNMKQFNNQNNTAQSLNNQNKNVLLLNDPLGHIYETISVSSIANGVSYGNAMLNNQNSHQSHLNTAGRALRNANHPMTMHRPAPPQPQSFMSSANCANNNTNQYIDLDSQIGLVNGGLGASKHANANEMMFFNGYDSTNEHSTTSSTDYSSSQQSQDSYLKILPTSNSSKALAQQFNLIRHQQLQQQQQQQHMFKLGMQQSSHKTSSPAASSSLSLLTTTNLADFEPQIPHDYRHQHQMHLLMQQQQQQQQNRYNHHTLHGGHTSKNDYLQPDLGTSYLNGQSSNPGNTGNDKSAILFTNRIEAVV